MKPGRDSGCHSKPVTLCPGNRIGSKLFVCRFTKSLTYGVGYHVFVTMSEPLMMDLLLRPVMVFCNTSLVHVRSE